MITKSAPLIRDCCEQMLAIIFIESHVSKHCFVPDLALRNVAQNYAKGGTFGFRRGIFVSSGRGALGFDRGAFA